MLGHFLTGDSVACVCFLKKLWVWEKINLKFVKPSQMKNLPWDREKGTETVWHTVKPWQLRRLRETPVLDSLFNTFLGLMAWNFIRKRLQYRSFRVNFAKFLRAPFLQNISRRLLLNFTMLSLRELILKYLTFQALVHGIGAKLGIKHYIPKVSKFYVEKVYLC